MNVDEIKTLEVQAEEIIAGLKTIKSEAEKKVSDREEFESEIKKIVKALEDITAEMKTMHKLFKTLGKAELVKLFNAISDNNESFKQRILELDTIKTDIQSWYENLDLQYINIDNRLAENNKLLDMHCKLLEEKLEKSNLWQSAVEKKIDDINKWLGENGDIILANSRIGIFGRKK